MMPTRYTLDIDLKNVASNEVMESSSKRLEARKVCFSADSRYQSCTDKSWYMGILHLPGAHI